MRKKKKKIGHGSHQDNISLCPTPYSPFLFFFFFHLIMSYFYFILLLLVVNFWCSQAFEPLCSSWQCWFLAPRAPFTPHCQLINGRVSWVLAVTSRESRTPLGIPERQNSRSTVGTSYRSFFAGALWVGIHPELADLHNSRRYGVWEFPDTWFEHGWKIMFLYNQNILFSFSISF